MKSKVKKAAVVIIILTLLSKGLGFIRELILAYWFNASNYSDAYLLSSDIITILFGWLTSFSLVFTPIYSHEVVSKGRKAGVEYTRKLITLVGFISILAIVFTKIFSCQIVTVVAHGLSPDSTELVSSYLRIAVLSVAFSAVSEILISYLNVCSMHIKANSLNLPFNLFECLSIFVAGFFKHPELMVLGIVIGQLSKLIVGAIWTREDKVLKPTIANRADESIHRTFAMFFPVFISSMLVEINTLVDKSFASYLPDGSITILNYGAVTRRFIFSIFSVLITSILYPRVSKLLANNNRKELAPMLQKLYGYTLFAILPVTAVAIIYRREISSILFVRGSFDESYLNVLASVFAMYCVGLLFMILNELNSKIIYADGDPKTSMLVGIISIGANIILDALLISKMGVIGLALATSLSQLIIAPVYYIRVKRAASQFFSMQLLRSFLPIVVSGLIAVIAVIICNKAFINNIPSDLGILITGTFIMFLAYLIVLAVSNNKVLRELYSEIKK